jgi:hypothetical protein
MRLNYGWGSAVTEAPGVGAHAEVADAQVAKVQGYPFGEWNQRVIVNAS